MNRLYAKDQHQSNYFGFDLGYDKTSNGIIGNQTYSTPQYNGNIEGTVWKSKGDGEKRKYDFTYDAANRLTAADFNQYTGAAFNKTANVDFSVSNLAFDANGNIVSMNQKGLKLNTSTTIDQLTYTYQVNSNKLAKVADAIAGDNKLGDFKDGTNGTTGDYNYDANGNLTLDNNKSISSITYNHLNLPYVITVTGKGTITYTYDAAGNKLKKTTLENPTVANNNISTTTITTYLGGFVYETKTDNNALTIDYTDRLLFIPHEEGRIRFKPENNTLQYDYMLKDHLGNVRMVLTEELQIDKYPVASLEPSKIATEKSYYGIVDANVVAAPAGMPAPMYNNDNGIGNNPTDATFSVAASTKMYDLKATSTASSKTGLGITLKVMSGDRIDIFGKSYWKLPAGSTTISSPELALAALDLLNALTGTTGVIATGKGLSGSTLNSYNNIPMTTGSNGFLNNQPAQTTTLPKAYINYIFFDENFNYVSGGFSRVGAGGVVKDHIAELQNKVATKSGYLYIYCSNESQIDVFFDNLQVKHTKSPILEETHYYPFGLTMSGISSKAAGKLENKYKYNGIELNTDFDLNIGETFFRSHDPQLGRWWQIDPKPNEMLSPYAAMNNNPLLLSDPLGDTTWLYNQNGAYLGVVNDKLKNQTHYLSTEGDPGTPINVSGKNAKTLGQSFRKSSIAFIGSKTVSDMRSIVNKSVAAKVEIGFVGVIGKDKEIRLNALPVDESNKINSVDVGSQISKNYPSSSDQKSLFLEGHTHIADYVNGVKFGDGSPMAGQRGTGTPTKPEDYTPVLDRGNGVAGPAPSLLATPFGVTLYGTGHMTPIGQPSPNNSYLIYKSLK